MKEKLELEMPLMWTQLKSQTPAKAPALRIQHNPVVDSGVASKAQIDFQIKFQMKCIFPTYTPIAVRVRFL